MVHLSHMKPEGQYKKQSVTQEVQETAGNQGHARPPTWSDAHIFSSLVLMHKTVKYRGYVTCNRGAYPSRCLSPQGLWHFDL